MAGPLAEPDGERFGGELASRHGQGHRGQLRRGELHFPTVDEQEEDRGVGAGALVAVDERVALHDRVEERGGLGREIGVQVLAGEGRPGRATAASRAARSRRPAAPPNRAVCKACKARICSSERTRSLRQLTERFDVALGHRLGEPLEAPGDPAVLELTHPRPDRHRAGPRVDRHLDRHPLLELELLHHLGGKGDRERASGLDELPDHVCTR